jgi:Holliday junction resolvasome RuvABC endonuclease subunit
VVLSEEGAFLRKHFIENHLTRKHKGDPPITEAKRIERVLRIANEIIGFFRTWNIRFWGIEGYSMGSQYQAHQIGELAGVVKTQMFLAFGVVPIVVPPSAGRKHVLGYGVADKATIVKVVQEGLGYPVENDHEADAAIVARFTFDKLVADQKEIEP